jgi:hypothetical protein
MEILENMNVWNSDCSGLCRWDRRELASVWSRGESNDVYTGNVFGDDTCLTAVPGVTLGLIGA